LPSAGVVEARSARSASCLEGGPSPGNGDGPEAFH
jgi:hypothetical protein